MAVSWPLVALLLALVLEKICFTVTAGRLPILRILYRMDTDVPYDEDVADVGTEAPSTDHEYI